MAKIKLNGTARWISSYFFAESIMTFSTDRHNIKAMFRFITLIVMILFCLGGTVVARHSISARQFPCLYSMIYDISCLASFRMTSTVTFIISLAFFGLAITRHCFAKYCLALFSGAVTKNSFTRCCFTFFSLKIFFVIFQFADFTLRTIAIFFSTMFEKFRKRFDLFAVSTSFCLSLFRYNHLIIINSS